jgi:hypothetical protein
MTKPAGRVNRPRQRARLLAAAYLDRLELWIIDGDPVRHVGLVRC